MNQGKLLRAYSATQLTKASREREDASWSEKTQSRKRLELVWGWDTGTRDSYRCRNMGGRNKNSKFLMMKNHTIATRILIITEQLVEIDDNNFRLICKCKELIDQFSTISSSIFAYLFNIFVTNSNNFMKILL